MQIFELKPVLIFSLESSKPRKSKDTKLQESFLDMEQQFQDITGNSFISCFRAILLLFHSGNMKIALAIVSSQSKKALSLSYQLEKSCWGRGLEGEDCTFLWISTPLILLLLTGRFFSFVFRRKYQWLALSLVTLLS